MTKSANYSNWLWLVVNVKNVIFFIFIYLRQAQNQSNAMKKLAEISATLKSVFMRVSQITHPKASQFKSLKSYQWPPISILNSNLTLNLSTNNCEKIFHIEYSKTQYWFIQMTTDVNLQHTK